MCGRQSRRLSLAVLAAAVLLCAGPANLPAVTENRPPNPPRKDVRGPDPYRPSPEGPLGADRPVDDFLDSNWFPLNWPALAFESASRPVIWTIEFIDRYRIHKRVYDLLTNDERTAAVYPFASFGNEGLNSIGVRAFHKNLFDDRKIAKFSVDWDMDRAVSQKFRYIDPAILGSPVYASIEQKFGRYKEYRFYGTGNRSREDDRYSWRSDYETVVLQAGYGQGQGFGASFLFSVDHSDTEPEIPSGTTGTAGVTPVQLDTLDNKTLLGVAGQLRYDGRKWKAETLEGFRVLGQAGYYQAPGKNRSRFVRWTADAAWFQPLIRRGRVLVVRAYLESVHDTSGGVIGLFDLPTLGGDMFLRGFASGRFRDRTVLALTQEYRFPIWRLIDFTVFADEGRVMNGPSRLSFDDMHFAWGASIRARRKDLFLWRFVFAQSKEGIRLGMSFNQEF